MKKISILTPREDFESPMEKLLRQEHALMDSLQVVTESPVEKMLRRERALVDSLTTAAKYCDPWLTKIQTASAHIDSVTKVFRDMVAHHSIFDKIQQSISFFDRFSDQMSATSTISLHVDSIMAVQKSFDSAALSVSSVAKELEKRDEQLRSLLALPQIEATFSRLARQLASATPVPAIDISFEQCAKLAAQIESIAPTLLADFTLADIPSKEESEKALEDECKELVDVLKLADGDYFQFLGNLAKPGSKIRKVLQILAILLLFGQICGSFMSGYSWLTKFLVKRRAGGQGRARVVDSYCVVTPHQLNIRATPEMKARVLGFLSKGQVIRVVFKVRHWACVVIDDQTKKEKITGFVGGKYLKPMKPKNKVKSGCSFHRGGGKP